MSTVMDAIAPPAQELLLPSLYDGLIISKHFDPEALFAEVEEALRFVWPDPDPVHQITETSWSLYEPAELLALIEENERAAAQRQAIIDRPSLLGPETKLINGVVYHNAACASCGKIRLMPADATLCVPCAARTDLDTAEILDIAEEIFALPTTSEDPPWMEPDEFRSFEFPDDDDDDDDGYDEEDDDEHPVLIAVAADVTPEMLAALIIEHPYAEVWRGLVAATDPLRAGEIWDQAMTIADRVTAP